MNELCSTYTCSCCKHSEYRQLIGGNAYYCTVHNVYMYPGSTQCKDFDLEHQITTEHNQDGRQKSNEP